MLFCASYVSSCYDVTGLVPKFSFTVSESQESATDWSVDWLIVFLLFGLVICFEFLTLFFRFSVLGLSIY